MPLLVMVVVVVGRPFWPCMGQGKLAIDKRRQSSGRFKLSQRPPPWEALRVSAEKSKHKQLPPHLSEGQGRVCTTAKLASVQPAARQSFHSLCAAYLPAQGFAPRPQRPQRRNGWATESSDGKHNGCL